MSDVIKKIVNELVNKYSTNNPIELADILDIKIMFASLESTCARYVNVDNNKFIIVNDYFKESTELKFIIAHELFHAIRHDDIYEFYRCRLSKKERECNEFAYRLLTHGLDLYALDTIYDVVRKAGVPYEFSNDILEWGV